MRKNEHSPAEDNFGKGVDDGKFLYEVLQMGSQPETIRNEVIGFLTDVAPEGSLELVNAAFDSTLDLYAGKFQGYRSCNTGYHDLRHILETFLAMARLLHGSVLEGEMFDRSRIPVALIAALFHDSGYIQESRDLEGTGAKYTETHVVRSVSFLEEYGKRAGLTERDIHAAGLMIRCTDLGEHIPNLPFPSSEIRFLGEMLNVADLWSQMADRVYLEKLFHLFSELREGKAGLYQSQSDLLRKTIGFYHLIMERFKVPFGKADVLMARHFEKRWNVSENLYRVAIRKHKAYLLEILELPEPGLMGRLKRNRVVRDPICQAEGIL